MNKILNVLLCTIILISAGTIHVHALEIEKTDYNDVIGVILENEIDIHIDVNSELYFDTIKDAQGNEVEALCVRTEDGDSVEDTTLFSYKIYDDGSEQLISTSDMVDIIEGNVASTNDSRSFTISNVYVTAFYEYTTKNGEGYFRPYKVQFRSTVSPSTVSAMYRICGWPYTLDYDDLDEMVYPNFAIIRTQSSPVIGQTYAKTSYCPRRYKVGGLAPYHDVGVSINGGTYAVRSLPTA